MKQLKTLFTSILMFVFVHHNACSMLAETTVHNASSSAVTTVATPPDAPAKRPARLDADPSLDYLKTVIRETRAQYLLAIFIGLHICFDKISADTNYVYLYEEEKNHELFVLANNLVWLNQTDIALGKTITSEEQIKIHKKIVTMLFELNSVLGAIAPSITEFYDEKDLEDPVTLDRLSIDDAEYDEECSEEDKKELGLTTPLPQPTPDQKAMVAIVDAAVKRRDHGLRETKDATPFVSAKEYRLLKQIEDCYKESRYFDSCVLVVDEKAIQTLLALNKKHLFLLLSIFSSFPEPPKTVDVGQYEIIKQFHTKYLAIIATLESAEKTKKERKSQALEHLKLTYKENTRRLYRHISSPWFMIRMVTKKFMATVKLDQRKFCDFLAFMTPKGFEGNGFEGTPENIYNMVLHYLDHFA